MPTTVSAYIGPVCAGMLKLPLQFLPMVYRPYGDDDPRKPIRVYPDYESIDARWNDGVRINNRDDLSTAIGMLLHAADDAGRPVMRDTDRQPTLLIALPVSLAQEFFGLAPAQFSGYTA
jgi:hypothetical protein